MNKISISVFILIVASSNIHASEKLTLDTVRIDLNNKPSLQRGAQIYINNCLGCHTLQYQRYSRLVTDLGIPKEILQKNLIFTSDRHGQPSKLGSLMINSVNPNASAEAFGIHPPDLSLIARSRGPDWVYTFLNSFYYDQQRPMGVNNYLYPNINMPHVLWWMEGIKEKSTGTDNVSYIVEGNMSDREYKSAITDLVNFLTYVSEPAQLKRYKLGFWVVSFLAFFAFIAFLLKQEYWKDVE